MKRIISASSVRQTLSKLDGNIYKYLSEDNKIWIESVYSDYNESKNTLEISIEIDGDWKHEHLRADYLMKEYFHEDLVKTREDIFEESEDDSYYSRHVYTVKNANKYFDAR